MTGTPTHSQTLGVTIRAVLDDARHTRTFGRGEAYHQAGAVRSLAEDEGVITAKVRGTQLYRVTLRMEGDRLDPFCTCPAYADSGFCKHCVAVGLTWLERLDGGSAGHDERPAVTTADVRAHLSGMTKDALVSLILEQAERDERLDEGLRMTVAAARSGGPDLATFRRVIDGTVDTGGFVDWNEAYDYAQGVHQVIDSLDGLLAAGHGAAAVDLAEYALSAAERQMESIDDSDGCMGEILRRLQDLHLAACRKAKPNPEELARRLFAWEMRGDWGVFGGAAETYARVFGKKGLAAYRELAEAEWAKIPPLGPDEEDPERYGRRFRITSMMEALARQSGDMDELVDVMSRDLSHGYGFLRVAEVLREAGRAEEAVSWAERGLAAFPDHPDRRLRLFLADEYHRLGRHDEAMALIWQEFVESPRLEGYQQLKKHANRNRTWPTWREKALALLRDAVEKQKENDRRPWQRRRDASELVRVFLWERDPDRAWREAQAGGCSEDLWLELAGLREKEHPADALGVYRSWIDPTINRKNNDAYRDAVRLLHKVLVLMKRLGREGEFGNYLASVQATHKRKRNLMKLIDKRKWT